MNQWPQHDWSDPEFASEWEALADESNPVRRAQLDLLLALLRERGPATVLDLGVGSGLVAEPVLEALPEAQLIGLDSSPAMLALAGERLARFGSRVRLIEADLSDVVLADCLAQPVEAIFSVQTLHNLDPDGHRRALASTADAAPPGALLVIADRYAVPPGLFAEFRTVWARLGADEGATVEEHASKLEAQGDQPVPLATELRWLDECGFDAACLQCLGNRAVLAGRRR
jgi:SAM-dependent methyltransferase